VRGGRPRPPRFRWRTRTYANHKMIDPIRPIGYYIIMRIEDVGRVSSTREPTGKRVGHQTQGRAGGYTAASQRRCDPKWALKYLAILICSLFVSCHPVNRPYEIYGSGIDKGRLLSFSIALERPQDLAGLTLVRFKFTNIFTQDIYLEEPDCFGVNVMPFATDSLGRPLDVLYRIRAHCEDNRHALRPSDSFSTVFHYPVEQCFDLSSAGLYHLYFAYRGHVYDSAGRGISTDTDLLSNVVEITTE
jgi:hypothetical protein